MQTAELIVCERTGRWAVALRQARSKLDAQSSSRSVRECRTFADCERMLRDWPASLVAVEATAPHLGRVLLWIAGLERAFPLARAVVLAERGLEDYEGAFREAGALHVVYSPRQLDPVDTLAERQIAGAPERELSLTEQVEARLPWAR